MADTTSYFEAAYIAAGVIYAAYCVALWRRSVRVRQKLAAIAPRDAA